jgi:hypothetical protein
MRPVLRDAGEDLEEFWSGIYEGATQYIVEERLRPVHQTGDALWRVLARLETRVTPDSAPAPELSVL